MNELHAIQHHFDEEAAGLTVRRYRIGSFAGEPQRLAPYSPARGIMVGIGIMALLYALAAGFALVMP